MAAIHAPQRVVIDRFDAKLQRDECPLGDLVDHRDLLFVDAIRPRADREADDFRMIDRIRVQLAQVFGIGVGIREGLKVDDEFVRIETFTDVFDAFADLIADRIGLDRRGRPERVVVAVGAAADGDRAVAIRTGEARIDDDFVNAFAEFFLEPAIVGAEPFGRF